MFSLLSSFMSSPVFITNAILGLAVSIVVILEAREFFSRDIKDEVGPSDVRISIMHLLDIFTEEKANSKRRLISYIEIVVGVITALTGLVGLLVIAVLIFIICRLKMSVQGAHHKLFN